MSRTSGSTTAQSTLLRIHAPLRTMSNAASRTFFASAAIGAVGESAGPISRRTGPRGHRAAALEDHTEHHARRRRRHRQRDGEWRRLGVAAHGAIAAVVEHQHVAGSSIHAHPQGRAAGAERLQLGA